MPREGLNVRRRNVSTANDGWRAMTRTDLHHAPSAPSAPSNHISVCKRIGESKTENGMRNRWFNGADGAAVTITMKLKPTRPGCEVALAVRWCRKVMLRTFGFRCIGVTWADGPGGSNENSS